MNPNELSRDIREDMRWISGFWNDFDSIEHLDDAAALVKDRRHIAARKVARNNHQRIGSAMLPYHRVETRQVVQVANVIHEDDAQ